MLLLTPIWAWKLPVSFGKGSKAALEGAASEHEEAQGRSRKRAYSSFSTIIAGSIF